MDTAFCIPDGRHDEGGGAMGEINAATNLAKLRMRINVISMDFTYFDIF